MGVFMAMMVVGMIYYVWGLGGTIIFRERMQDAADSGAFGASVYAAAGMNMIAFMNVLMAIVGVIGAAARMIQDFASVTIDADIVECAICVLSVIGDIAGGCQAPDECGGLEAHEEENSMLDSVWSEIAQICDTINEGIHVAQEGVSIGAFAGGEGLAMGADHYHPQPVTYGVLVPGNVTSRFGRIQSTNDQTNWACDSRGTLFTDKFIEGPALILAEGVIAISYEPINLSWIAGEASMLIQAHTRAEHYCNNGNLTFQTVPTDAWLGDQSFQNYVVDFHTDALPFAWTQQGVQASNWGREGQSAPNVLGIDLHTAGELQRMSIADSEYYYEATMNSDDFNYAEGDDSPGITLLPDTAHRDRRQEWLFHPFWRARMRRFHANTGILGSLGASVINEVESVIVH
jgi:hypothetical protein